MQANRRCFYNRVRMQSYLRIAFTCAHIHPLSVPTSLPHSIELTYSFVISSSEGQDISIFLSIHFVQYSANG